MCMFMFLHFVWIFAVECLHVVIACKWSFICNHIPVLFTVYQSSESSYTVIDCVFSKAGSVPEKPLQFTDILSQPGDM